MKFSHSNLNIVAYQHIHFASIQLAKNNIFNYIEIADLFISFQ